MKHSSAREITREDLYELVWQRPMWKVAPEFGLSGNGLAKLCRREGIPVPERGYWAKLAHGKRVKRASLQPPKDDSKTLLIEATPSNRTGLESSMPEPLAVLLRAERDAALEPIRRSQLGKAASARRGMAKAAEAFLRCAVVYRRRRVPPEAHFAYSIP